MIAILAIMDTVGISVFIAIITALKHLTVVKGLAPGFVTIESLRVTVYLTPRYMVQLEMVRT